MANTSVGRFWPNTMTSVAARAMPGKDMMMSMMRMMTSDTHLRDTAAMEPKMEPKKSANAVAPRPMTSEVRAPIIMRESTSRPLLSVPKGCSALGAWLSGPSI